MLDICKSCKTYSEVNDDGLCVDCVSSTNFKVTSVNYENKEITLEPTNDPVTEIDIKEYEIAKADCLSTPTLPDDVIEELAEAHIESVSSCECCDTQTSKLILYNTMNMCQECYNKELALEKESTLHADERVANQKIRTIQLKIKDEETDLDTSELAYEYIKENKLQIDTTIKTKEDFFNANTLSIIEMKAQIEQDNSIERKHFALSERLLIQFKHLREQIFKRQEENVKDTSTMRSIQQYLNEHANKLRASEREKLKLEDINYKPSAPKKAKTPKVKKVKFDKKELKRYAELLGGIEHMSTLQMLCVAQNLQPEGAYKMLKGLQGKS